MGTRVASSFSPVVRHYSRSHVTPAQMPVEQRLMGLCRKIISQPSAHISLDAYARGVGLTPKTALRLFHRELGMNFRQWRQLVQTAYAVAHLAQGEPKKVVASQL